MMNSYPSQPSKTHRGENFPVASRLVAAKHRPVILAFYHFARAADDVADAQGLTAAQKATRLDEMERSLLGDGADQVAPEAANLAVVLRERGLGTRHPRDLLEAFRLDVFKHRHANWDELMAYCALSAMPVGRFVLDVHGEPHTTWPASDAVCAALQVINHLQDCGADFRNLDRVYLPLDRLAANGVGVEALAARAASPGLRKCIDELADKVADLLRQGQGLADEIVDWRLRLEISVIHALAVRLTRRLKVRDPLSEETHLSKFEAAATGGLTILQRIVRGFGLGPRQMASGARG